MRENRQSGSEGGGNEHNRFSLPLSGADGEQAIHRAVGQSFELGDPGGKGREAPGNKRENGSGILFGGSPKKEYCCGKPKCPCLYARSAARDFGLTILPGFNASSLHRLVMPSGSTRISTKAFWVEVSAANSRQALAFVPLGMACHQLRKFRSHMPEALRGRHPLPGTRQGS